VRSVCIFLIVLVACSAAAESLAGPVSERVKARGTVRCGSSRRPGLADTDARGSWTGLHVDVCRAIAAAVLGSADRIEYHEYETPKQFDAIRSGQDDVYFLTGSEINEQKLAGMVVPGPTVFVESHNLMVPADSAVRRVDDLSGKAICFFIGSPEERSLSGYFGSLHKSWLHMPFSEEGEMNDAYDVRRCQAVAGEVTTLAAARLSPGPHRFESRILPEPISIFPVIAATGTSDGQWSSVVAWTVITLISGERAETAWYAGGSGAMPALAPELGLDGDWQRRVLSAVGNYGDIFDRNLGKNSRLKLDRGLNENRLKGGELLCPFLE